MSISVVIPAFDEGSGIDECLRHLSRQGDEVLEIVVVDNASTDDTADRVRAAAVDDPRIRLLHEPTPGVAHARYRGFAEARGDLIASVDSDTLVGTGWASAIAETFGDHPSVMAGTAPIPLWDLPFQGRYRRRNARLDRAARRGLGTGRPVLAPGLSGANSVIRRSAWTEIADEVSVRGDVFEDLDRWLLLRAHGHAAIVVPGMSAVVSGRRLLTGPRSFVRYAACGPRTYALHHQWRMFAVSLLMDTATFVLTMAKLPVNRAWDPAARRFSVARIIDRAIDHRASPIGRAQNPR
ncbi:glycosyltransferase family 2 protein [uncultured Williamsia sp.]|uniref:glycosyltransferase family 2 protein n=1 Tax=uncultured Williamsia sp. TaxID=259311 RepID=UPI00260AA62A|nr:glycosyltransferase family 2 protein [uncultured Williamsia sp.]